MLIRVMYPDNSYDYVREFMLNNLIDTEKIVKFRRSGGWVPIVEGHVRSESLQNPYKGAEKRVAVRSIFPQKSSLFQAKSFIPRES
jgi:hypothetical protein